MATYQTILDLIETNLTPTGGGITADLHREVEEAILQFARDQWLPGDIKEVDCTPAYIAANFDQNGIGIGERLGWAICNGYNGLTKNRAGRVSVGYGAATFNGQVLVTSARLTPGATEGSETHKLTVAQMPSHKHGIKLSHERNGEKDSTGYPAVDFTGPISLHSDAQADGSSSEAGTLVNGVYNNGVGNPLISTGGNEVHNNMQPYIVTLFIQKL